MKKYQAAFGKAVMGSFGWLTGILFLLKGTESGMTNVLTAFASAVIIGGVFTIGYPLVWNDLKINRVGKITLSAILNITAGLAVIRLLLPAMFTMIFPWTLGMLTLSIAIHSVTSIFYYQSIEQ
ncbi:hypothetical protein IGI39_004260 [Enterococcus sp. AZ135]|uniref:hypothetical protein n=1 Tax=unclassified Enterococcus TaxID=2608891 RepID=UPI003F28DF74